MCIRDRYEISVFGTHDHYTENDIREWHPVNVRVFKIWGARSFAFCYGLLQEVVSFKPDLIHLNGLWQYSSIVSYINARKGVPVIISPRGMLDRWALKNSFLRKWLAMLLYERNNLNSAFCIHALNEVELNSIRNCKIKGNACIIPNAVDLPVAEKKREPLCKKVLFLGRLHEKKGIIELIDSWNLLMPRLVEAGKEWQLIIAGSGEKSFEEKLRKKILSSKYRSSIQLVGFLTGKEKEKALLEASVFVLPSFSEGMPMAILEAWSYGLPVVMTKECNIPKGEEAGAAMIVVPERWSLQEGLKKMLLAGEEERIAMGRRGYELVKREFTWQVVSGKMISIYDWALGIGKEQPDCLVKL